MSVTPLTRLFFRSGLDVGRVFLFSIRGGESPPEEENFELAAGFFYPSSNSGEFLCGKLLWVVLFPFISRGTRKRMVWQ